MDPVRRERYREMAEQGLRESIEVKEALMRDSTATILDMADMISRAFRGNHRLFLFGNGGSAADAQHVAAEFVNRFQRERPPLAAIALTVDSSVLTSIGNDFDFEEIFVKQLRALAQPGDVALGISTSGRSPNVVKALKWAAEHRVQTVGWVGAGGGEMDAYCDILLRAPSRVTARIQECHITVGHILCLLVDEMLFGPAEEHAP
ncbi:SIS domain-containing protein [Desulforhabdus sp. TSK]|uniref:D-sedoheptulose-7-phosphate isomerase n=1 Tax=Desulforhabdus sp. TSK TaxID=2925014 RepID=UPI001FC8A0ED|nr:D-sedoheptulose 7-phosphate isomerase [Desulforhabdus sp. TSK]GKT08465.1 phosphoheptose isomerase [Desulforhabdus sp. TSK]